MAISLEAGENALPPRSSAEKVDRPNVSKWNIAHCTKRTWQPGIYFTYQSSLGNCLVIVFEP